MATPQAAASKTKAEEPKNAAPKGPNLEGFVDESTPDLEGWYANEMGNILYGKICGHLRMKQKDEDGKIKTRDVVAIELYSPCQGKVKGDETLHTFDKGAVVGVGISHDLKKMLNYVEHRGIVYVKPLKKEKLAGGRSLWKFEQKYKGKKAALQVTSSPSTSEVGDDDDIPF